MHKERVLITGASGFIGSQLIKYLLSKDYAVIGLSRQSGRTSSHPDLTWVQQLDELKTDQIDYVINLAGESIGKGRWTAQRKQQPQPLDPRVGLQRVTRQLAAYNLVSLPVVDED